MIQVFKPYYGQEEMDAVKEVLESGWTGLGPKTAEFEKEFEKQYCNGYNIVGLNSCTAALDMALKLYGVNRGDQVCVPTITFVSTAHVVKYNLADPIFIDVDPVTLNMDLNDLAKKITCKTKAVIAVHYSGRPVDMHTLFEIVREAENRYKTKIAIIEDCAHACGSTYQGMNLPLSDVGCFSFHAVKNLSMGEGGALALADKDKAEWAKKLRWLGIDKGTWERSDLEKKYWWEYNVKEIGLKSHMDDIHAAIGLVQLKKLKRSNSIREVLSDRYNLLLKNCKNVITPPYSSESSWHLYCIQCERRDELSVYLRDNGVNTGVHYKPIHLYPCYGNTPSLPSSEGVFPKLLTLPLYPELRYSEVAYICDKIKEFYGS